MQKPKKIVILIEKQEKEILVSLSSESDLPDDVKLYLELNSLTIFQKIKYNRDINNSLKEYVIKMSRCSLELEENNRIWMKKFEQQRVEFEQQRVEFEQQRLEFEDQRVEFQQKFEDQKNELQLLQRTLIDNGIQISKK